MNTALDTGIRNARNVGRFIFGSKAINELAKILGSRRKTNKDPIVFLIDEYFQSCPETLGKLPYETDDQEYYVSTAEEPTTESINCLVAEILGKQHNQPSVVVGIGGGITLDTAKAASNLITNGGRAEDYQGWDLVKVPGVHKIGVPTLSGTGAEATRTCVLTNKETGLKLGMNSEYTVFDQLILDPDLTASVPRYQYFYTGMDAWIHCIESLAGNYRHPIGDAYSTQAIDLCREVFKDSHMMSDVNRAKLMVASYLGGCAIAMSYVGVVHPFSAGLSVVLGLHHCLANCISMAAMESFYPSEHYEFMGMIERQSINLPQGICASLTEAQYEALYRATIIHEKPLTNALGEGFREILTEDKVRQIFEGM
jgi:3-deoxy-alpha-D-manno-octulosonate 8-oxidase